MSRIAELVKISKSLAIYVKASGIEDFGCHYDEDWNLTEGEWKTVCANAERLLPTIVVPEAVRRDWDAANRAFRAEQASEQRSVYGGEF